MKQARLMLKLRVKIDSWSQGVEESVRHRNRGYLEDMYRQLPQRRVWFYLKYWRNMILPDPDISGFSPDRPQKPPTENNPEDIVAKGRYLMSQLYIELLLI